MVETIWSAIAVVGGLAMCGVILYFLLTGRNDREQEEEARRFFDEHGHWPDEWLGRCPFKAEIAGSNPAGGTRRRCG
jgi:hypothetical protein